jgi:hypothetical protein
MSEEPAPARAHHGLALGHEKNNVPRGPAKPHEAQVPKQPEPKVGHGHDGNGQGNDDDHQGDSREAHGHSGESHGHNHEHHGHSGESHGHSGESHGHSSESHGQGPAEDHGQNGRGRDKH